MVQPGAGMPGLPGMDAGGEKGPATGSLAEFIEKNSLECLNQDNAHPVANAFDGNPDTYLSSDTSTDDQLLISVAFRSPVKISAVKVTIPAGAAEDEAPTNLKIFLGNDNSIGFDEAETRIATADFEECMEIGKEMPVKYVKFQNVQALRIFVPGSAGRDVTKIQSLQFFGTPAAAMDMKAWKPIKG